MTLTEKCKHGLQMTQTCLKCGRIEMGNVANFEARKNGFTNSIRRLEEAVRIMQIELAKGPPPARADAGDRPEAAADGDGGPPPPPPPPERYPWQRR